MIWGRISRGWVSMNYIATDNHTQENTTQPETQPKPEAAPEQPPKDAAAKVETIAMKGRITADALRIRSGPGAENSIIGYYYQDELVPDVCI